MVKNGLTRWGAGIAVVLAIVLLGACASQEAAPAPPDTLEEDVQVRIDGVWDGALKVQGTEIQIVVKFLGPPPSPEATIDIPPQMAYGLPLSNVELSGDSAGSTVHFELATGGPTMVADGTVGDDGTITGTFTQGPASGEFTLARISDLAPEDLPESADDQGQESTSGTSTDVSIVVAGTELHGTLLVPGTTTQVPLVIIIAGSGPTDRNGNSALIPGQNNGLRLLAEGLAENGIASLRYDKRGVARSTVANFREEDLLFGDYVNDLLSWVLWANSQPGVSETYLAGHSEGGLVVLTALASGPEQAARAGVGTENLDEVRGIVAGAICIAAPGRPFDQVTLEQLERNLGADSELFAASREIYKALREGSTMPDVPAELDVLFRPGVRPYLQSLLPLDPAQLAAALPQPLLVIGGTEDIQVPVSDAQTLADAQPASRLAIIAGMNHVLKLVPTADLQANQRSYADPSFELAGELVDVISGFVNDR